MITRREVEHIAKLARVNLSDDEIAAFEKDLSSILGYFEMIKELDTSSIEPTFHPTENFLRAQEKTTRKDEAIEVFEEGTADKLIAAAPDKSGRHVKVKAVLN